MVITELKKKPYCQTYVPPQIINLEKLENKIAVHSDDERIEIRMDTKDNKKERTKQNNIFQRGKKWYCRYYTFDEYGRKKYNSKGGFSSKKEAEKARQTLIAKVTLGQSIDNSKITVEEQLNNWFCIHKGSIAAVLMYQVLEFFVMNLWSFHLISLVIRTKSLVILSFDKR